MHVLIIGGTRNMGHLLALSLLQAGHRVTVFNRGVSKDELPGEVERLRGDRTVKAQLKAALHGRQFDAVVDMVLYTGEEAETTVSLLKNLVGHYLFVSTGQVYLVRENLTRPFSEADYDGPLIPSPRPNTYGYEEWHYGIQKRAAEDTLARAWASHKFPYTSLRLPMVNGEREPFNRLYGYMLRIKDGGGILTPDTPQYPLRHVYANDVVKAMMTILESGQGKGKVYNISQDETVTLPEFLGLVADLMKKPAPKIAAVERSRLEAEGLLPDCSPFSDRWMSELTNDLSKAELGMTYTPLRDYLERIVRYYQANPPQKPASYRRRNAERHLINRSDE
ncbi:MAG: NAD-dependent epimerase/dehydratase family protein [Anaerolineae bacterium]|nr:NAD-dependent epimerase/dehydratase family protein [Anaerolineae bacterium]